MKYWISVTSQDHVLAGIEGGFTQASQDKVADLQMLHKEDVIFFYSPGTLFRAGQILQALTAVGRVTDDRPFQGEGPSKVRPWRRAMTFLACEETPIAALVPGLDVIKDKANWAASLRRGIVEIGEADARRIATAMSADLGR